MKEIVVPNPFSKYSHENWEKFVTPGSPVPIRAPFGSFDIIIYFGVGLFCIPFLDFFVLRPFRIVLPETNFNIIDPTITKVIAGLSLAFIIYVIGHLIVYLSGQLIQKPMEAFFGKTSRAVLFTQQLEGETRNSKMRKYVDKNIQREREINRRNAHFWRLLSHAPVLPIYVLLYCTGVFGYYYSRISDQTLLAVHQKLIGRGMPGLSLEHYARWFPVCRFDVINCNLMAASRMQNFFITKSLMRSLSLIFLFSIWAMIYYLTHLIVDNHFLLETSTRNIGWLFALFYIGYFTSLLALLRFQRRYVEEAIYAYSVSDEPRTYVLADNNAS